LACAALLVIKLVPHTPLLVLLWIVFLTIGILRYRNRAEPSEGWRWLRQIVLLSPIAPPGMWMPESSRLSDDGIHSNARGSQAIAERVAVSIKALQSRRQTVLFQ
jgi:lysophospholipase L1-like esterase